MPCGYIPYIQFSKTVARIEWRHNCGLSILQEETL